jgi:MFS family permease
VSVPLLARRDFRLLWAGGTVSALGSWLLVVAVPYQVYRVTGSTTATGLSLAAESLPALLVGPWAGVLVDRWHRVRVADLAAAAAVLPLLAATGPGRIWLVYLALVAENLAVVFLRPATGALTPEIVGTGPALTAANSFTALTSGVLRLAGPALGPVLLSTAGLATVVVIDAATYLVAAAATARIAAGTATGRGLPPAAVYRQLRGGLRHLVRDPVLRGLLTASGLFLTANAALTALLVPFLVQRLGAAGDGLGYLIAGLGVGYVLGAAVNRRLPDDRPRTVICAAQAAVGACFLVLFHTGSLPAATVAAGLTGIPGVILLTTIQTHSQRGTPNRLLGRVGAAFDASAAAAAVLGALLGPAVVAIAGLPAALTIISAAALASTAASAVLLPARQLAV